MTFGIVTGLPTALLLSTQFPAVAVDGTFVGPAVNINYGNVQVKIVVANGRISDAIAVQSPTGRSERYTSMSIPILKTQTLAAQSTQIQGVSGASYTSYGWLTSLQGALAMAGLPEVSSEGTTSSNSSINERNNAIEKEKYFFKPAPWDGLPSNLLTPGATVSTVNQNNIKSTICSSKYVKKNTPSATFLEKLKTKQIKAGYVVDGLKDAKLYAIDFLIPIELGGSPTNEENLWPQLIDGRNGHIVKNKLEKIIYNSVCSGQMTLKQGQDAIGIDWMEEYELRFGNQTGTRYANSSKSGSNGLVSMNFQGGDKVDCSMNRVHSIDLNMYGITDWTYFITYPGGYKSEISKWNSTDNVYLLNVESGSGPGTYLCTASINGENGVIATLVGSLTIDSLGTPVRATRVVQTLVGSRIDNQFIKPSISPKSTKFKNCTELNTVYPGGVALPGAYNKGGSTALRPTFDREIYATNISLDRDKDGIACEK